MSPSARVPNRTRCRAIALSMAALLALLSMLSAGAIRATVAAAAATGEAKVMFCDCTVFDEDSTIQGAPEYAASSALDKGTARTMVQAGWTLQSVASISVRQFYLTFVRGSPLAPPVSDVKIMFCDCTIFDEDSTVQGAPEWFASSALDKSTTKQMVQSGWSVQSVVNLNVRQFYVVFVKKATPQPTDVKIMFCDCAIFDEDSTIQGSPEWFASSTLDKSTTRQMVQSGWSVQSVVALNPRQFYLLFVKTAPAAGDVKIMFCDCTVFDEDSTIQGSPEWFASSALDKSTAKTMVQAGWSVQSVVNLNLRQFYFVFQKFPAPATTPDQVKIMFCDCSIFDEDSTIQGSPEWFASSANDKSTTTAMTQAGWTAQSVVNLNGTQFYLTFVKSSVFVTEFYNTILDNYFITADANEAAAIDNGSAGPGWQRTGVTFKSGGDTAVCRFYGGPLGPNSHFYTADAAECQSLKSIYNPAVKSWKFESNDFLTTVVPASGTCPAATTAPVYRAYNNGFAKGIDSNHRITTSQSAIQEVVARGWKNEGVVMCAPL